MAEQDWATIATSFNGLDNDRKVQTLQKLTDFLTSIALSSLEDPDPILNILKTALKSSNSQIYAAGLACIPHYLPVLVPLRNRTRPALSANGATSPSPSVSSSSSSFPLNKSTSSGPGSQALLKSSMNALLVTVLDRMGDPKEKVRDLAKQSVVAAARASLCFGIGSSTAPSKLQRSQGSSASISSSKMLSANEDRNEAPYQLFDKLFLSTGLQSKVARTRATCIQALMEIRQEHSKPPLPLRSLTPTLVTLLEDQDAGVREAAKRAVMEIFGGRDVSDAARVDLKKELTLKGVRKNTLESILDHLVNATQSNVTSPPLPSSPLAKDEAEAPTSRHHPGRPPSRTGGPSHLPRPASRAGSSRGVGTSAGSSALPPPVPSEPSGGNSEGFTPASASEPSPVFIASAKDLDNEIAKMLPAWEGKETEHNWMHRDSHIARLRGMIKGGVYQKFPDTFIQALRQVEPGVLKTLFSLRTILCIATCRLISEMSEMMKQAFDPFVESYLINLLGMAGQTKKIAAQASQVAVTSILKNSSYHTKQLQHLWNLMGEKNVQARQYAIAHVKTVVEVHARKHRGAIESGGGLDFLQKLLKKGIADANAGVRETARASFWLAHEIFPAMTAQLLSTLDSATQKQLEKANPNKNAGPTSVVTALAAPPKRPSVRDMINKSKINGPARTTSSSLKKAVAVPLPPSPSASSPPPPASPPQSPKSAVSVTSSRAAAAATFNITPIKKRNASSPAVSPNSKNRTRVPDNQKFAGSPSPLRPRSSPKAATVATPSSILTVAAALAQGPSSPKSPQSVSHDQNSLVGGSISREESVGSLNSLSFGTTAAPERPRNLMDLSIDEPIVADALQAQAEQAEQTAERLLELVDPDEDEGFFPRSGRGEPPAGALPNFHSKRHGGSRSGSIPPEYEMDFEDSLLDEKPINTGARNDWWEKSIATRNSSPATSPTHAPQKADIDILLQDLKTPRPQLATLSTLGRISMDFPYPDSGQANDAREQESINLWDDGRCFLRLFEGLSHVLRSTQDRDLKQSSLSVLKKLVLYQFSCFSGYEMELFALLLQVQLDDNKAILAGVESVTDSVLDKIEPLYGLSALRSSLQNLLKLYAQSPDVTRSYSLALKGLGSLFTRLPAEVLEEEIPRVRALISQALNDTGHPDLRLSAVNCIVAAHTVLQDDNKLFSIFQGLTKHQEQLLTYYFARAAA
ncbi:hypothetical protein BT69DRAFT_1345868 [Atractiella rhizophila]|nr:hypothetical protein BT69DRAFT_1345868 [Atractiella rhizophila]